MTCVVIGVHGRAPKPSKDVLTDWWRKALVEGLRRNEGRNGAIDFELVYYADIFAPSLPVEQDREPYAPADGEGPLPTYAVRWLDELRHHVLEFGGDLIDEVRYALGLRVPETVLRRLVGDLVRYFEDDAIRKRVHGRLEEAIAPHLGRRRVMIVGHSKGSIVAYDVLRTLGEAAPAGVVDHFVTLGSPLGLPFILRKVREERGVARTPSVVARWTNLADRRDWVSLDNHLADDFAANAAGARVKDRLVLNTYKAPGARKPNEHKIYGYLRTPEMSRLVRAFLDGDG